MQVLIVDDDEGIRNRLIDGSTARGHEVVVAATPQQALTFLQRERFDMIFMRWHLTEESHLAHLRHVRSGRVPSHSYIVLLAAQEEAEKVDIGLDAGADNFLLTPFDPASLRVCFTLGERLVELEQQLWETRSEVERLALYDMTTGLPNHQAIEERARAELSRAQRSQHPLSLILLDLSFQLLGDENRHTTGEQALRLAGSSITQSIRPYDWAGRWRDREFLLVLPDTTMEQAKNVQKRVHEQISAIGLLLPDGTWFKVEPTSGVVEALPNQDMTIERLLGQANEALHHSRARGQPPTA